MSGLAAYKNPSDLQEELKKVLPTLPQDLFNALIIELQSEHGVYSASDLPDITKQQIERLENLKGVQKVKFLEYVESKRSKKSSTTQVSAVGFETGDGERSVEFKMSGDAKITVKAVGGGRGVPGSRDVHAKGIVAKASGGKYTMKDNASLKVEAGTQQDDDFLKMDFKVALKQELPTFPDQKISDLVDELNDTLGVHSVTDFLYLDVKDLKLESLVGAEVKLFREFVQRTKDNLARQKAKDDPPPSMFN